MPKYVIERNVPGAGALSPEWLQKMSAKSVGVLRDLGPDIQWVNSYVTGERLYCVYNAPNEDILREHAQRGGFPIDQVSRVTGMIDPTTAEG